MKKLLILMITLMATALTVYAVDSTKPEDHGANWVDVMHGKKAKRDSAECYTCHTEKLECITCHEDSKPRSHNLTWTNKTHGMEARWKRDTCATCHTEDTCIACHETTSPSSHRGGFRNGGTEAHCERSCTLPVGRWKNTPSKDCIVCHPKKPLATHAGPNN